MGCVAAAARCMYSYFRCRSIHQSRRTRAPSRPMPTKNRSRYLRFHNLFSTCDLYEVVRIDHSWHVSSSRNSLLFNQMFCSFFSLVVLAHWFVRLTYMHSNRKLFAALAACSISTNVEFNVCHLSIHTLASIALRRVRTYLVALLLRNSFGSNSIQFIFMLNGMAQCAHALHSCERSTVSPK